MFSWDSCGNASPWQPRKWSFEMWQQFNPKQDLIVTLIRQFYWLNITKKFFCLNFPKQWMKTKLRSKSNIKEITRIISSTRDWKVWSLVCNQKLLPLFFWFVFLHKRLFTHWHKSLLKMSKFLSMNTQKDNLCPETHINSVILKQSRSSGRFEKVQEGRKDKWERRGKKRKGGHEK